ncbi:unnamed protein product, partial [Gulo gulo]
DEGCSGRILTKANTSEAEQGSSRPPLSLLLLLLLAPGRRITVPGLGKEAGKVSKGNGISCGTKPEGPAKSLRNQHGLCFHVYLRECLQRHC